VHYSRQRGGLGMRKPVTMAFLQKQIGDRNRDG
jgi:hypothetical protein